MCQSFDHKSEGCLLSCTVFQNEDNSQTNAYSDYSRSPRNSSLRTVPKRFSVEHLSGHNWMYIWYMYVSQSGGDTHDLWISIKLAHKCLGNTIKDPPTDLLCHSYSSHKEAMHYYIILLFATLTALILKVLWLIAGYYLNLSISVVWSPYTMLAPMGIMMSQNC